MIPVEKNKTYNLKITDVSSDGNGIGHIDGFAVFVPQTAEGDVIECLIVKVRTHFAYGKAMKIIEASPYRSEPLCKAYRRCGGCQLMHIDYEKQKHIKKECFHLWMKEQRKLPLWVSVTKILSMSLLSVNSEV